MRGASRASLSALLTELESQLGSEFAGQLGTELLGAVAILDESPQLRRSLADDSVAPGAKDGIVSAIFGSRLSEAANGILRTAVAQRWAFAQDFVTGIEVAAVSAIAASTAPRSQMGELEEQLFRFGRLVESSHELQRAFAKYDASVEAKQALVDDLIGRSALPETVALVKQAASHPRGKTIVVALGEYGEIVAARAQRAVAQVTVAKPLSQEQHERLAQALSHTYGRKLTLDVSVDPQIVGGVRVQVGDEVMDDSVANRISDVRRRLAG